MGTFPESTLPGVGNSLEPGVSEVNNEVKRGTSPWGFGLESEHLDLGSIYIIWTFF